MGSKLQEKSIRVWDSPIPVFPSSFYSADSPLASESPPDPGALSQSPENHPSPTALGNLSCVVHKPFQPFLFSSQTTPLFSVLPITLLLSLVPKPHLLPQCAKPGFQEVVPALRLLQ